MWTRLFPSKIMYDEAYINRKICDSRDVNGVFITVTNNVKRHSSIVISTLKLLYDKAYMCRKMCYSSNVKVVFMTQQAGFVCSRLFWFVTNRILRNIQFTKGHMSIWEMKRKNVNRTPNYPPNDSVYLVTPFSLQMSLLWRLYLNIT